jgi:hypothetical protein
MNRLLTTAFLTIIPSWLTAQNTLTGTIYYKQTDSVLSGISVTNATQWATSTSDKKGRYSIPANEGDKIVFSATGMQRDTITVTFTMLLTQHNAEMKEAYVSLKNVTVTGGYTADSLRRRNEYRYIFDSTKGFLHDSRSSDGVGISISPLSYFSAKAKAQRKLKRKLLNDERESYIDFSFQKDWVASLTGLKGDSLNLFMYQYRPGYDFCRKTDRQGMIVYISDSLKEFRKPGRK